MLDLVLLAIPASGLFSSGIRGGRGLAYAYAGLSPARAVPASATIVAPWLLQLVHLGGSSVLAGRALASAHNLMFAEGQGGRRLRTDQFNPNGLPLNEVTKTRSKIRAAIGDGLHAQGTHNPANPFGGLWAHIKHGKVPASWDLLEV